MKRFVSVLLALLIFAVPCFAEYDLSHMSEAELQELIEHAQIHLEAFQFEHLTVSVDYVRDGYITVQGNDMGSDCKLIVNYDDINLQYDLNDNEPVIIPLQFGSGAYTIYLGRPMDVSDHKDSEYEYKEFEINNVWGEDGPTSVKGYEIYDVGVVSAEIGNPYACFLYPNCYVMYSDDSMWVMVAAELTKGIENDTDKVNVIIDFVNQYFIYDYIKSVVVEDRNTLPDIGYCWMNRMGISQDLSALTCSMLRSQGIPAMLVYGSFNNAPHHWVVAKCDDRMIYYDPSASLNAVSSSPVDFLRRVPIVVY